MSLSADIESVRDEVRTLICACVGLMIHEGRLQIPGRQARKIPPDDEFESNLMLALRHLQDANSRLSLAEKASQGHTPSADGLEAEDMSPTRG